MKEWYGPTKECAAGDDCRGCLKCMRVMQLIEEVRAGNLEAAMELANRVEFLMGPMSDVKPGTAAALVCGMIEPTPSAVRDALANAVEMKRATRAHGIWATE